MIGFQIGEKKYSLDQDHIEAICVFGSFSRGEEDQLSDIDILILIDLENDEDVYKLKLKISKEMGVPMEWLSLYRVSTFEKMAEKGSYFLWHLLLEGKVLYSKNDKIHFILKNLNEYEGVQSDLEEYQIICSDISEAIEKSNNTINYELSLIASIIRNTCIAIAYMDKEYLFGRTSPVEYVLNLLGEYKLFEIEEYKVLYKYRISYTRPEFLKGIPDGSEDMVMFWIGNAKILLEYAINKLKGRCVK